MRLKLTMPKSFFNETSLWPFQAILEGRQSWNDTKKELNPKAAALAIVAPLFFL